MKLKYFGIFAGLICAAIILLFFNFDPTNPNITKMAAIAALMAIWWITEAIPLAATSLLPLFLFPLLGIEKGETIAGTYINSTIFLFLGGFLIALAMEKWKLHKRIALKITMLFGGSPDKIIFGFMTATAFISMWISNTATAVMMFPIGLSIILQLEEKFGVEKVKYFSSNLMLSIAYGASIGGIATLIGTPPNLSFVRILHIIFPEAPEVSFGSWILIMLPMSIVILFLSWVILTKLLFKVDNEIRIEGSIIKQEYDVLGKISFEEKIVGIIFSSTALLWIFRTDMEIGSFKIPGWAAFLRSSEYINDGTVAIAMASLLFLIPSKNKEEGTILNTDVFSKLPWDIILLFGGGFALAKGFISSGLSQFIGNQFAGLSSFNPIIIMLLVAVVVTLLSELTSNTATAEMILPILASVSVAIGINPMLLMVTGTISASMGFMLPIATPPNAVVFGSRRIKVGDMAKAGILLDIAGILILTVVIFFLGKFILGIDLNQMPAWAKMK